MSKSNGIESVASIRLRDEILMKEMVPGICTFQRLQEKAQAFFTSESALRQRLSHLMESGYIQSRLYPNQADGVKFALYTLDSAGIEYLCSEKGYTADEIRTLLPSNHTVGHEMVVTDVVRQLRWESMNIPYELRYYDDPACRGHKKLLGLKAPVPDLLVDLRISSAPQVYRFNIEVHMGTVPLLNVLDKALKQENQTIYLCNTRQNLNELRAVMQNHAQLQGIVYFGLIYDFCQKPGGIFGTNYTTIDGCCVSLYP